MNDSQRDDCTPLNLHQAARDSEAAGFTRPVQLQSHQAAHLARSLRGMDAVNRILISETGDDCSNTAMVLGDNLRMGLMEAVGVMIANASELLENLIVLIRERESGARKLKAMTGETRVTALVLALLPLLVGGYFMVTNPTFLVNMWHDASGQHLLIAAFGLQAIGCFALWRMVRSV